jgi:hypothetical protein
MTIIVYLKNMKCDVKFCDGVGEYKATEWSKLLRLHITYIICEYHYELELRNK